jgi:hypothetical protein
MAPIVSEWVALNKDALLQFWREGEVWTLDQLNTFARQLNKIPRK